MCALHGGLLHLLSLLHIPSECVGNPRHRECALSQTICSVKCSSHPLAMRYPKKEHQGFLEVVGLCSSGTQVLLAKYVARAALSTLPQTEYPLQVLCICLGQL